MADATKDEAQTLRAHLEAFRDSGIRIDRNGQFWHEGAVVEHAGLRQALFRWLDRLPPPDSRYILRLDDTRYAYIDVEDTPLVVNALLFTDDGAPPLLQLSDGSEEPLDPTTVSIDDEGVLRVSARGGHVEARLSNVAATALAEHIEVNPDEPWGPRLALPGQTASTIARRARQQPSG